MKKIPVSIYVQLTTFDGGSWRQQLTQYHQLGYSLIELDVEIFQQIAPEDLAQELRKNQLRISAIQVADVFTTEKNMIDTLAQLYRVLPRFSPELVQDLVIIIKETGRVEELSIDLQAGYWHNLLKNLQFFTHFMADVFSIETLIQPGRAGLMAEEQFVSQLLQSTKYLGLWLDTGFSAFCQRDPLQVLQSWPQQIRYLHLTDVNEAVFSEQSVDLSQCTSFVGEGVIDFGILYDQLQEVPGVVTQVCVQPLLPTDVQDYWAECASTLRFLEKIGFN